MLALIRIPLILIYFILLNLVLLLMCVVRPFHRNNVHYSARAYGSIALLLGIKVIVRVSDKLDPGEPVVYIGNHQNSYDLITICSATQPGTVTVGKKSLAWVPLMGQLYWLSGNILIDRKNLSKASNTVKQTIKKIRQRGISVWLFPEGTRSYGRGLLPFKSGAFLIARGTREPVSMICASNLHDKVRLNRWNNGVVLVEVTEPVALDKSRSVKQWSDYFHQQMQEKITQLDKEVAEMEMARR
ncbi:1-acylglycerol-3-phosphate O-acyltransferase [Lacimicrobium alkaliphilum]|uniref:1-acyl-sn-glycerol-3-phosphate acyltransferase n=1 Tax=Lacimicrobium alkaliphilum TaxID=1526571 RepID=A0ABQ1R9P8_9ALTE|nr:1-acylglycerol-3-phosphate O-acyltransferase [Lacimicrobium alkaliphilum]GGD61026.1 1-acyl-sn-glycerol-3-phosphate acyltransferase [Lacimicrobium alkaliphilum]